MVPDSAGADTPSGGLPRERCQERLVERLEVTRLAGDQSVGPLLAHLYLPVDPGAARVADVGAQTRPGLGPGPDRRPPRRASRARQIAATWKAALEERADDRHGPFVEAQRVRVGHAARQHEPVEGLGRHVGDHLVDREGVRLVEVMEGLDPAGLRGHEDRLATRVQYRLPGIGSSSTCSTPSGAIRNAIRMIPPFPCPGPRAVVNSAGALFTACAGRLRPIRPARAPWLERALRALLTASIRGSGACLSRRVSARSRGPAGKAVRLEEPGQFQAHRLDGLGRAVRCHGAARDLRVVVGSRLRGRRHSSVRGGDPTQQALQFVFHLVVPVDAQPVAAAA